MKFSQNGYDFSDEEAMAPSLNDQCKRKKVKAKVFVANKNDFKEYVLFNDKGIPEFSSAKMEEISAHIDIMSLKNHFD